MKPDGEHSIRFSKQFAQKFKSSTPARASKQNSESRHFRRTGEIAPIKTLLHGNMLGHAIDLARRFALSRAMRTMGPMARNLGAGLARCRIFYAAKMAWRQGWCEPTERLAYVGPPLRRRTSATCGNLLTKTTLLTIAEQWASAPIETRACQTRLCSSTMMRE